MEGLDVVVVGGGANGLVCALVLARGGLKVAVVEGKPTVGGGCRTDYPFAKAPRLAAHPGAHRVGFVPRDLLRLIGVSLPLVPRDPCELVPTTTPGRAILAGPGHEAFRAAVAAIAPDDAKRLVPMHSELDAMLADLAPAWVAGPLGIEETAERFVKRERREAFVALCRGSLTAYLDGWGIESSLVRAAIAAEALSSTFGSPDSLGTGGPLLVHHAARSPAGGGDGIPEGGMGALVRAISEAAQKAGVAFTVGSSVQQIVIDGNMPTGVVLRDGTRLAASTVVCSADPFQLRAMVGDALLPSEYVKKIDGFTRPGSIAKVSLALSALPKFTCAPEERGQHGAVMHLLPGEDPFLAMRAAFAEAEAGRIPTAPPIEMVIPTASDASQSDPEGRHHASLLVPWAPYDPTGTSWPAEEEGFLAGMIGILESFAPGTRELVVDSVALSPKKLETNFGVTRGHAHHVDDGVMFGDRLPYATPLQGLYACGAGCAPAGGIFGAAGHNAAKRVLADLELGLERTEVGRH
jgi:phytoene dehydrogenase-like protein